jgi:hypothetical protein
MKQVIFLGFYCQIYKKAPTARIYIGDVMIDEIEVPEFYIEEYIKDGQLTSQPNNSLDNSLTLNKITQYDLNPELYEKKHLLDNYWWEKEKINDSTFEKICLKIDPQCRSIEKIQHPKIFVYVIDDKFLKLSQYKLKIEIKNSDSNYVNGFMSKSTLLYPSIFYIMPYTLFEDPINYTQRYIELYSRKTTACKLMKIISWYKSRFFWPKNFNNYFTLVNNKGEKESLLYVFGGDATLEITMKKKYGIYWPEKMNLLGFFRINRFFVKDFVVRLIDKYKQDENQRNTD